MIDELAHLTEALNTLGDVSPRSLDAIAAYGEQLSSQLVVAAFRQCGVPAEHVIATADYFAAMGIRLVAGRAFIAGRVDHVAVVSESFAKQLRTASPLGLYAEVLKRADRDMGELLA